MKLFLNLARALFTIAILLAIAAQLSFDTLAAALHHPLSFTTDAHARLQTFSRVIALLSIAFIYISFHFEQALIAALNRYKTLLGSDFKASRQELNAYLKKERTHLLALIAITLLGAALRAFYINTEIKYDEAANYILFADRPFVSIFTIYTMPNNHILHTVFMRLSLLIFGNSEVALRLPAYFAGVLCIPVTYFLTRALFATEVVAFIATLGVSISTQLVEYSVSSRGYALQCLFTLVSFLFLVRLLKNKRLLDTLIAGTALGLGFVAHPAMLFAAFTMGFWILFTEKLQLKTIVLPLLIGIAVTILGYLPAALTVGAHYIYKNPTVAPQSWSSFFQELPAFLKELYLRWSFGHFPAIPYVIGAILIVGALKFRKVSKHKMPHSVPLLFGFSLCLFLTHKIPPIRTVIGIAPLFIIAFAEAASALFLNSQKILRGMAIFCTVFLTVGLFSLNRIPELALFPESTTLVGISKTARQLAETVKPNDRIVLPFPDDILLHYYFSKRYGGNPNQLLTHVPNQTVGNGRIFVIRQSKPPIVIELPNTQR